MIVTHTLSTIFAMGLLATYSLVHRKEGLKVSLIVGAAASALTAVWWLQFLNNLEFTSGRLLSILWDDPVISLLPSSQLVLECMKDFSAGTLLRLPMPALVLAVGTITAVVSLIGSQRYALPSIFLVLLLVLPRNVLPQFIDLPIHYYRFVMPLFGIMLVLASYGLTLILDKINHISSTAVRASVSSLVSLVLLWALLNIFVQDYGAPFTTADPYRPVFRAAQNACAHHRLPASPVLVQNTRAYPAGRQVIDFLGRSDVKGRVASEMPEYNNDLLGSPHFFSSLIPIELGAEVLPGLLAESSYSSGFFPATIGFKSGEYSVGRDRLSIFFHERNPLVSLEGIVHRLRLWGVEYLIATSLAYKDSLGAMKSDFIEKVFEAPPFAVFKIREPAPRVRAVKTKPYLFIDRGGIDFREFAEEWYKSDSSIHIPVVSSSKYYEELSKAEQEQIRGFIVSVHGSATRPKAEIDQLLKTR